MSKSEILIYLLEGTVDSKSLPDGLLDVDNEEHDIIKNSTIASSSM